MTEAAEFDFAQVRLQARHGARLSETAWSTIEAAVSLGQFVENIRATAVGSSLNFFRATTSAHQAEQALRSAWRRSVFEAARWAPSAWRSAVQWLASAADLSILIHLRSGASPPDWLQMDAVWSTPDALARSTSPREALLGTFSRLASEEHVPAPSSGRNPPGTAGTHARPGTASVIDAWIAEWRSRWPRLERDTRAALEALIALLRRHLEEMRAAESAASGRALRHELRLKLARLLHAHAQTPIPLIAHLLLVALDFERLRDGLIRRMLTN